MAVDYFLKIDGIDGESEDDKHKNEIELSSFNWSEAQSGTFSQGGGGGAGKVRMDNFDFTMRTNKASPKLFLACATGQHIPSAVLTCRKAGGGQQEFYSITMTDVLVSRYETGSSGRSEATDTEGDVVTGGYDEGAPTDHVRLNFGKIQVEYRPQKEDGSLDNPIKAGYSLKANKSV
jgi:type VI secretion system secreted protein Hcp